MVMALEGTPEESEQDLREKPDHFAKMIKRARPSSHTVHQENEEVDLHRAVAALISSLGGEEAARELTDVPSLSPSGDALTHTFQVGLPIGSARRKLQSFASQWNGTRGPGIGAGAGVPGSFAREFMGSRLGPSGRG